MTKLHTWDYVPELDPIVNSDNGIGVSYNLTNDGKVCQLTAHDSGTGEPVQLTNEQQTAVLKAIQSQVDGYAMHIDSLVAESRRNV